ncbi:MAG: hypothetical protein KF729_13380, partial [Sandaracinaceae bacterium]|nr:hypothetical protein [Sandaracinaceae bacterium]
WRALPWALAAAIGAADALVLAEHPGLGAALVGLASVLSFLCCARFVERAIGAPPPMDRGLAHPVLRFFARGARSLPRFSPDERDGSRRLLVVLGPLAGAGWLYAGFIAVVWPIAALRGDLRPDALSPAGTGALVGAQALSLAVLAIGYLVADLSERPRVRALLDALDGSPAWRAWRGVVEPGAQDELLVRRVFVEGDSVASESPTFSATNEEGGASAITVRAGARVAVVERAALAWASDDWVETPKSARMRVRPGARVLVAGYAEGETLRARGPGSMMLFACAERAPDAALRAMLRARAIDAALASLAALATAAIAIAIAR